MPKTVDGYICTNGHGELRSVISDDPTMIGHALVTIERTESGGIVANLNKTFVVEIFICDDCGYLEFYDVPSENL